MIPQFHKPRNSSNKKSLNKTPKITNPKLLIGPFLQNPSDKSFFKAFGEERDHIGRLLSVFPPLKLDYL